MKQRKSGVYLKKVTTTTGGKNDKIYGSSGKSVGEFRFGELAHREKQCDFKDFIASKAVG